MTSYILLRFQRLSVAEKNNGINTIDARISLCYCELIKAATGTYVCLYKCLIATLANVPESRVAVAGTSATLGDASFTHGAF